jgi:hypothetical protein
MTGKSRRLDLMSDQVWLNTDDAAALAADITSQHIPDRRPIST